MTDLNAEITTTSMKLLKVAKGIRGGSLKEIIQEAVDSWLAEHGYTPELLNKFGTDPKRPPRPPPRLARSTLWALGIVLRQLVQHVALVPVRFEPRIEDFLHEGLERGAAHGARERVGLALALVHREERARAVGVRDVDGVLAEPLQRRVALGLHVRHLGGAIE